MNSDTITTARQPGEVWTEGGLTFTAVIVSVGAEPVVSEIVQSIPCNLIDRSPYNRKKRNAEAFADLCDNVARDGQKVPAVVRPKADGRYELNAGEGRWLACQKAGIQHLKCFVREMGDGEALENMLLDNVIRENLSPIGEARIFHELLALQDSNGHNLYTRKRIAERIFGTAAKESQVRRSLSLLELPESMVDALEAGHVKPYVAYLVSRAYSPEMMQSAADAVLTGNFTVKQTERWMETNCMVNLVDVPFDKDDPYVLSDEDRAAFGFTQETGVPNDGSCARCTSLIANNPEFAEAVTTNKGGGGGVHPQTCLRPACYQAKIEQGYREAAYELAEQLYDEDAPPINVIPRADTVIWFFVNTLKTTAPVVEWLAESPVNDVKSKKPLRWDEVLRDSGIKIEIWIKPDTGTPLAVVNKEVALQVAKDRYPHAFAQPAANDVGAAPAAAKVAAAKTQTADDAAKAKALARKALEAEQRIQSEINHDALVELEEALKRSGVGIEILSQLWKMIVRQHPRIDLLGRYIGALKPEEQWEDELREWPELQGTPMSDLFALIGVALSIEDVNESGALVAADFLDLCKLLKVSPKAIEKRVRKAHQLAATAEAANKPAPEKRKGGDASAGSGDSGVIACPCCDYTTTSAASLREHVCKAPKVKLSPKDLACKLLEPVPASEPNEQGVFEDCLDNCHEVQVTKKGDFAFSIGLARDKDFHWYYGTAARFGSGSGIGGPSLEPFATRAEAIKAALADIRDDATRGGIEHGATAKKGENYSRVLEALDAVQAELDVWDLEGIEKSDRESSETPSNNVVRVADMPALMEAYQAMGGQLDLGFDSEETGTVVEDDEPDAIDDLIDRVRFYRDRNPSASIALAAEDLGAPYDDVVGIWDRLIDEEFAPRIEAEKKQKEIDILRARRDAMPKKPKKAEDPDGFKAWDRERKNIANALKRLEES